MNIEKKHCLYSITSTCMFTFMQAIARVLFSNYTSTSRNRSKNNIIQLQDNSIRSWSICRSIIHSPSPTDIADSHHPHYMLPTKRLVSHSTDVITSVAHVHTLSNWRIATRCRVNWLIIEKCVDNSYSN